MGLGITISNKQNVLLITLWHGFLFLNEEAYGVFGIPSREWTECSIYNIGLYHSLMDTLLVNKGMRVTELP